MAKAPRIEIRPDYVLMYFGSKSFVAPLPGKYPPGSPEAASALALTLQRLAVALEGAFPVPPA